MEPKPVSGIILLGGEALVERTRSFHNPTPYYVSMGDFVLILLLDLMVY